MDDSKGVLDKACHLNGYHVYLWLSMPIKCCNCSDRVEGYQFANIEDYKKYKNSLYCDACAPDIPF